PPPLLNRLGERADQTLYHFELLEGVFWPSGLGQRLGEAISEVYLLPSVRTPCDLRRQQLGALPAQEADFRRIQCLPYFRQPPDHPARAFRLRWRGPKESHWIRRTAKWIRVGGQWSGWS